MIILIIGTLFGGIVSWVITHQYYKKTSEEQTVQLRQLLSELKKENTLKYFEYLLENSNWVKEIIGNDEIWISKDDNTFQIHCGESVGIFAEDWVTIYPDPNAQKYPVYLKINNSTIKEILFISIDGDRIFVPITERKIENNIVIEFWNMESLRIKVCKIIGKYHIYKDIVGVANVSKIEII